MNTFPVYYCGDECLVANVTGRRFFVSFGDQCTEESWFVDFEQCGFAARLTLSMYHLQHFPNSNSFLHSPSRIHRICHVKPKRTMRVFMDRVSN